MATVDLAAVQAALAARKEHIMANLR